MEEIENKKIIRPAIYLRVSTDEQVSKYGLDAQLDAIKKHISKYDDDWWVFDEDLIYREEWVSGVLEHRPELDRLMEDAKKNKFDIIIVSRLDRFFRNMRYLLDAINKLEELKIGFVSVSERFDATPVWKLMLNIFWTLA